jgi:hypothetical protein
MQKSKLPSLARKIRKIVIKLEEETFALGSTNRVVFGDLC